VIAAVKPYESDVDLWADEALLEPYAGYQELRDVGPVVHLQRYGIFALSRFKAG
jgi:hypothetical protein